MKIIALHNVEVAGYGIVKRGEIIDFSKEKIDERIAANFLDASDDSRLKPAKRQENANQPDLIKKTKEEMLAEQDAKRKEARADLIKKLGVDGIREQLAQFHIPFTKDMKPEKLADLYLDRTGEEG